MYHQPVTYRERAQFYEVEYTDVVDADFLYSLITPSVSSILEIPCGVGRNVLNLARSGRPIVAVDREPEMVRALERRLAADRPPSAVEVRVGEFTALRLERRFDLILVPREAFQLLTEAAAAAQALSSLAAHLSERGHIVIDLSPFALSPVAAPGLRPDYFDPDLPDGVWADDWCRRLKDGSSFKRQHLQSHEASGLLRIAFRYEFEGEGDAGRRTETTTDFRIYRHGDFIALAEGNGLAVAACYGDYARKPFEEGDPRMIFVLERRSAREAADARFGPGQSIALSDGFSNGRDAARMSDPASAMLRPEVLRASRSYAESYFSGPFIEGQGSEVILDSMFEKGLPGRTLDVGAGSSTMFWHLPVRGPRSITCADVAPEPLVVLKETLEAADLPACYGWIAARYGLDRAHIRRFKAAVSDYAIFDALTRWPRPMDEDVYDLITAFGVLSLNPDASRYGASFVEIARHLRPGGRTIGADWIRRPEYRSVAEHDNSYLDSDVLAAALQEAGLKTVTCRRVPIAGDVHYEAILHWVADR